MAGLEESFDEFVAGRSAVLLRLAYFLTQDQALAEDLVQEALAKAFRRWSRVAGAEDPERYVRRIVVNEYAGWRRLRRNQERPGPIPEQAGYSDHAQAGADRAAMWQVLSELKPRQRAILVLRYYEGLPDSEIASLLNCSEGSVRGEASRAFAVLRVRPELQGYTPQPATMPIVTKERK